MDYLSQKRVLRVLDIHQTAYGLFYSLELDAESWIIARGNLILLEVYRTWKPLDILVEQQILDIYFGLIGWL